MIFSLDHERASKASQVPSVVLSPSSVRPLDALKAAFIEHGGHFTLET